MLWGGAVPTLSNFHPQQWILNWFLSTLLEWTAECSDVLISGVGAAFLLPAQVLLFFPEPLRGAKQQQQKKQTDTWYSNQKLEQNRENETPTFDSTQQGMYKWLIATKCL